MHSRGIELHCESPGSIFSGLSLELIGLEKEIILTNYTLELIILISLTID